MNKDRIEKSDLTVIGRADGNLTGVLQLEDVCRSAIHDAPVAGGVKIATCTAVGK